MGPRRALIVASVSRYSVVFLQLIASLFVSRHVLPAQFGVVVLGNGALLLAGALREFGTLSYLVQQKELHEYQVRSAFTLSLLVTVAGAAALMAAARPLASFYDDPLLAGYLRLIAWAYALGPFANPIVAMLTREMAFKQIAVIDVGSASVNLTTAVVLVMLGFGSLSVAWAAIAGAFASLALAFWFKRDLGILRPSFQAWRAVLSFGFHGAATAMIFAVGETLSYLMIGKLLNVEAVGLAQRSYMLTQYFERVLLSGAGAVALPAFARMAREGQPLVAPYLRAIRLMAPVYLATMLALIVLARPLVLVLFGPQWIEIVPLTQILAAGHLVAVGNILNFTVLIAVAGIRRVTPVALFQMTVLLASIAVAAPFGLKPIMYTSFVTMPANTISLYWALHRHVPFAWRDIVLAIVPAVVVSACSTVPAVAIVASGWMEDKPLVVILAAAGLGGVTWLAALKLLRHPLQAEIWGVVSRSWAVAGVLLRTRH